jgi:hypothetical protein
LASRLEFALDYFVEDTAHKVAALGTRHMHPAVYCMMTVLDSTPPPLKRWATRPTAEAMGHPDKCEGDQSAEYPGQAVYHWLHD